MSDENKRNVHYFEASSMRDVFDVTQVWQNKNNQRFLSLSIERDRDKFCCIALTNPTEVVICGGSAYGQAGVTSGVSALNVKIFD